MRTLFYVPTLHTVHETMTGYTGKSGPKLPPDMARDHRDILRTWRSVRRSLSVMIDRGSLIPSQLHVFSDGIPVRPGSLFRTRKRFSPTKRCIDGLAELGARRRGTENRFFLLAHGLHILKGARDAQGKRADTRFERDIMLARDLFIATRMLKVVPKTQDAILFMGARHQVDRYLRRLSPGTRIVRLEHFDRHWHRIHGSR